MVQSQTCLYSSSSLWGVLGSRQDVVVYFLRPVSVFMMTLWDAPHPKTVITGRSHIQPHSVPVSSLWQNIVHTISPNVYPIYFLNVSFLYNDPVGRSPPKMAITLDSPPIPTAHMFSHILFLRTLCDRI